MVFSNLKKKKKCRHTKETESVHLSGSVDGNLVVEAVGSPRGCEETNTDGATKVIEL
jgi:hypothetical protein